MTISPFRASINALVQQQAKAGSDYEVMLADVATVLGCLIAAGSKNRRHRLARVKASMTVIAHILDKDL